MPATAGIRNGAKIAFSPDIAGVDADLIDSSFDSCDSQPVVKLNIRHQREIHRLFDSGDQADILHGGDSQPEDITAGLL